VTINATLTKTTWAIYQEMKKDMVAWLSNQTVSVAPQAITKILRLSQITSGFLGGIEPEIYEDEMETEDRPDWLPGISGSLPNQHPEPIQEIGREKLDVLFERMDLFFEAEPNGKLLVWCRFLPELRRMLKEIGVRYPHLALGCVAGQAMLGGRQKQERRDALRLLDPRTAPEGPAFVGGTYGTGSLGLNFTACHTVINSSFDYSLWKYLQSAARVDRPGQVYPVSPFDIVAVGPKGQKTIDHTIAAARLNKEDVATWGTSFWLHVLRAEDAA
jgi:hypothetical protein